MTTFQSTGAKEICILVVNDDIVGQNIVTTMLQYCGHYEVLNCERINDIGSSIISERRDQVQLVLTNVQKSSEEGSRILLRIEKEFKIPILPINPNYNKGPQVSALGDGHAAKICFLKSLSMDEFKRIWQHAYAREKMSNIILSSSTRLNESINNNVLTSSPNEAFDQESNDMIDETSSSMEKKQRFLWTKMMHLKFVKAVRQLGPERAVPKKIVEKMNIPGLTREIVASHLQKYRINKKQNQGRLQQNNHNSRISQTDYHHQVETYYNNHSSFEQTMLYGSTNQFLDVDENAGIDFNNNIQVDGNISISSASLSMGKNVEEPGNSYVGFRLTDNGKFVENEMQMNDISFGSGSAFEMGNEIWEEEGSIFLPCNPESSIDNPYFTYNYMQNETPLQENMMLDLDNLGIEVDMDDLFMKNETILEMSINPNDNIDDCFFDDIDSYIL